MDVFVIPIGRDRYELYSEQPVELNADADADAPGVIGRLRRRASAILRAAEERQNTGAAVAASWFSRFQDRLLAWVVERIAEQRLLWNLRSAGAAVAVHPEDMPFEQVMDVVRRSLRQDYERHRRWMIIDGIALLVTSVVLGPLFLIIPGVANLPAFYFAFRVLGHWLSMRGASQGIHRARWTGRPSAPLGELRELVGLEPRVRGERMHAIEASLRLRHLSTFVDRLAVTS